MANEIITILHPDQDPSTNLYPNIKKENVPSKAINYEKLDDDVRSLLNEAHQVNPSGVDTTAHIISKTSDDGIWISSDNGHWFYWDGTQYIDSGLDYLSSGNVVTSDGNQLKDKDNNNIYPNIATFSVSIDKLNNNVIDLLNGNTELIGNIKRIESDGFLKIDGTMSTDTNYHCIYTNYILCEANKHFLYRGFGGYQGVSALFFNENFEIISYVQSNSSYNSMIITTPSSTKYVKFCSYSNANSEIVFELISLNSIINKIDKNKNGIIYSTENEISYEEKSGFLRTDGNFSIDSNYHCKYTNFIDCNQGDVFLYNGFATYSGASAIYYDVNFQIISYEQSATKLICQYYVCPVNTKYVRFCSFDNANNEIVFDVIKIDNLVNSPLNRKKWCVLGDSFTAGDVLGRYLSYPSLICKRNKMLLQDFSVNGAYIHYGDNSPLKSENSYYYQNIDNDVDYITIAYGLNELSTDIGNKSSNDNTTIWGAYNEILSWIIANRPKAKIGIISNDGWMSVLMRNTLKEIANYWGVSFLDLKEYGKPLLIGGKYSVDGDVSPEAVNLKNEAYKISNDNSHPNELGQQARSTLIENWLKSI